MTHKKQLTLPLNVQNQVIDLGTKVEKKIALGDIIHSVEHPITKNIHYVMMLGLLEADNVERYFNFESYGVDPRGNIFSFSVVGGPYVQDKRLDECEDKALKTYGNNKDYYLTKNNCRTLLQEVQKKFRKSLVDNSITDIEKDLSTPPSQHPPMYLVVSGEEEHYATSETEKDSIINALGTENTLIYKLEEQL